MSQIEKKISARFAELADIAQGLPLRGRDTLAAEAQPFYSWAASVLSLLHGAFGKESSHSVGFAKEMAAIGNNYVSERHFNAIRGLFFGAKSDFDGGHIFNVERSVAGELFGDLVALAKAALSEGQYTVAAVLASAALEDALKRYATLNGQTVEGSTMEQVVNALKSQGLVSGPQKALLSAMPKIRNHAMHADWDKLTPQDAGSVVGFVEQFLLTHFS